MLSPLLIILYPKSNAQTRLGESNKGCMHEHISTHRGECFEGAVGDLQDLLLAELPHVEERRVEALELRLGDDSGPCVHASVG